ncbi:MAG TPA: pyridoxamine 5'-phosphate oxidase family protein [Candidatus Saccharimonadales bacterium]|nr:pyridoxamine 5'-phosphate oxidase family protein [Candidatus Saccharimonadales bacterium]
MDPSGLIHEYLDQARLMQIATAKNGRPWICTVYFVADKALNLYWLSLPTRRHSMEIMQDRHVAIAVAVKLDQPVIGVQAEGTVEVVQHVKTVQGIMEKYIAKYNAGHSFYDNFVQGKNDHRMYRFTAERFSLFDEAHFPDASPVEVRLEPEV